MKRVEDYPADSPQRPVPPDPTSDVRVYAAWFGLVLVAMGVAMAGYLFFRIGQVLLDPRSFETQVDRWEFVVRGRTTDAFPQAYETPDRGIIGGVSGNAPQDRALVNADDISTPSADPVEDTLRLVGRLGSKSARVGALLLLMLVLLILVKIIFSVVHAGIRLAALAGGEREYMKRIIDELADQRDRR